MRIALDGRLWNFQNARRHFFGAGIMPFMLNDKSGHFFFVILDQAPAEIIPGLPTEQMLVLKPAAKSAATRAFWYDFRLPDLLSNHQIDLFIGLSGYISLRSTVPQVLVLHDALSREALVSGIGWGGVLYRRRLKSMMKKSVCTLYDTQFQMRRTGLAGADRGMILTPGPLFPFETEPDESTKEAIKNSLTNGMEYFVCIEGWQHTKEALSLLVAFSAFKKRQQTGMKLVLLGSGPKDKAWLEKLKTFRYRDDLVMKEPVSHTEKLSVLSAAYALIHLPDDVKYQDLQYAIKLGVPVVTRPQAGIQEVAEDLVFYCTEEPGQSLAQWMMRLYTDEKGRKDLIQKALKASGQWHPTLVAERLISLSVAANKAL